VSDDSFTAATGTAASRAVTRHISMAAVKRRSRFPWFIVVLVLTGGLATVWTIVARRQLVASIVVESTDHLDNADKAFANAIAREQAELQSHCRLLVEDPRLKSTLATDGMNEETVADILDDLTRLRGTGFLMVLSPEGRVFAQSGASELRGLDLSDSSVVKKARTASTATVGSWVLAGRVMDLSIMAIRFGPEIIAYLVVGQSIDAPLLQSVTAQTGVHAANALAGKLLHASSTEPHLTSVLSRIASDGTVSKGRVITVDGTAYVTAVVQLGENTQPTQSHRLVLARPLAAAEASFAPLEWMILVPPLLVLIAVLFSMSVFRRTP
jgi:hypothetical protein